MTKHIAYSSLRLAPPLYLFVWVCPQQVAEHPSVRDLSRSNDLIDLLQTGEIRGKTPMHTQNPLINEC